MTSPHQDLFDLLIRHEGLRLRPYTDGVGKLSIGVGRNLTDRGISLTEAMDLLGHDVEDVLADLCHYGWFTTIGAVRLRALCDLRFNVGRGAFRRFVQLLAAVEAGDFERAAAELLDSDWAHQVQPSRVTDLHTMLLTGIQP